MRKFRLESIALIALVFASVAAFRVVSFATEREPNPHINYYPETGIVSSVDERNLVSAVVSTGVEFQFYAIGYSVGDVVSLLMDNNDTGNPYDDLVIAERYVGKVAGYVCTE